MTELQCKVCLETFSDNTSKEKLLQHIKEDHNQVVETACVDCLQNFPSLTYDSNLGWYHKSYCPDCIEESPLKDLVIYRENDYPNESQAKAVCPGCGEKGVIEGRSGVAITCDNQDCDVFYYGHEVRNGGGGS